MPEPERNWGFAIDRCFRRSKTPLDGSNNTDICPLEGTVSERKVFLHLTLTIERGWGRAHGANRLFVFFIYYGCSDLQRTGRSLEMDA